MSLPQLSQNTEKASVSVAFGNPGYCYPPRSCWLRILYTERLYETKRPFPVGKGLRWPEVVQDLERYPFSNQIEPLANKYQKAAKNYDYEVGKECNYWHGSNQRPSLSSWDRDNKKTSLSTFGSIAVRAQVIQKEYIDIASMPSPASITEVLEIVNNLSGLFPACRSGFASATGARFLGSQGYFVTFWKNIERLSVNCNLLCSQMYGNRPKDLLQ